MDVAASLAGGLSVSGNAIWDETWDKSQPRWVTMTLQAEFHADCWGIGRMSASALRRDAH